MMPIWSVLPHRYYIHTGLRHDTFHWVKYTIRLKKRLRYCYAGRQAAYIGEGVEAALPLLLSHIAAADGSHRRYVVAASALVALTPSRAPLPIVNILTAVTTKYRFSAYHEYCRTHVRHVTRRHVSTAYERYRLSSSAVNTDI